MPAVQSGAAPKDKSTPRISDTNALNHMDIFIIRRPGEKQSEVAENNTGQGISHPKKRDIQRWLISSNVFLFFFFKFASISGWADTVCPATGIGAKLLASIWVTDVAQTCVCRRWKSTVTGWNNDCADYSLELPVSHGRRRQRRLSRRRAS